MGVRVLAATVLFVLICFLWRAYTHSAHVLAHQAVHMNWVVAARCMAGARACPPEDCGGVHGFAEFLDAIADPKHSEHAQLVKWSGGACDPATFDSTRIVFDNPRHRWKKAFQDSAEA